MRDETAVKTFDLLDNPIWHALTGPHAEFAIGRGAARRYPPGIAPFAAIAGPTGSAYADLAADLPPGTDAMLFRPIEEPAPPGWEATGARQLVQMILPSRHRMPLRGRMPSRDRMPEPRPGNPTPLPLGMPDIADMLALAELTKPGPFAPRVIELGSYAGIRDASGRLIAMAGERLRLPGYVEISAVCVHPAAQGRGLGATLTSHVAQAVFDRGDTPILHVWPDNPARSLYTGIGFRERSALWVLWRRPIPA